jgi:transcriptional regulator with XRE-family HTH domain
MKFHFRGGKKMTRIGTLLKTVREQKQVTQRELAKYCGYKNRQYISNVERGLCSVNLKALKKCVKRLDIKLEAAHGALLLDYSDKLRMKGF